MQPIWRDKMLPTSNHFCPPFDNAAVSGWCLWQILQPEKHAKRKEKKDQGKGGVVQKEGWVAPGRRVEDVKKPAAEPASSTDSAPSEPAAAGTAAGAFESLASCVIRVVDDGHDAHDT